MSSWRLRDLLVDATRNVTHWPLRTTLLTVMTAGLLGALVFAELSTTGGLVEFEQQFVERGANIFVASNESGLDAAKCGALATLPGVVGSAAITSGRPVSVVESPGTLFRTGTITTGGLSLFSRPPAPAVAEVVDRWLLGAATAAELGLAPGMALVPDGGPPLEVGAVIDTQVRNPGIDRWVLAIAPPVGQATQCWVEYSPGARSGRTEMLSAVFAGSGDRLTVNPWIRPGEFTRDPIAELSGRPQAGAWLAAGFILTGMGWLSTWFRRSDIGLYRATGMAPSGLLVLGAVEHVMPTLVGACIGAFWATAAWSFLATGPPTLDQLGVATRTVASAVLLSLAITPLIWPVIARGSIARQLKGG